MTHTVFVYGSLLRGLGNHGRLVRGCASYIGHGATKPAFSMISLGAFPGVLEAGSTAILGELYEVNEATFADLDVLEGHPRFYERRETTIAREHGAPIVAWIYILKSRGAWVGDEAIASGDWRAYVEAEPEEGAFDDDDELEG